MAEWRDVPIDLAGDLGLAAWRALRENPGSVEVRDHLTATDYFGVIVTLSAPVGGSPSVVAAVKGLVDGPLAALQRADQLPDPVVTKLLGRRWARPIDEPKLLALVSAHEPRTVLPRAPFNRNGLDPCDEFCVAGIARVAAGGSRPTFSGRVMRVAPRS